MPTPSDHTPSRVLRFGVGVSAYIFPIYQSTFTHNFGNVVPRTQRMPGVSGGFDEYGTGDAPTAVGNVRLSFTLVSAERGKMQELRDQVMALRNWGVDRLYYQPGNQQERWVEARVNNINMPQRVDAHTDIYQPVTIDFQVSDPYWTELGTETVAWGDGSSWGSGVLWGSGATPLACDDLVNDFALNVSGVAITYPRLTFSVPAGASVTNLTIQRLSGGVVVDQIIWTGTLAASSSFEVATRSLSVRLNGANAYSTQFDWLLPSWFRLFPGENHIRVIMTSKSGNPPTLTISYLTRW